MHSFFAASYVEQLDRWFALFGPSKFLVLGLEAMKR
jgi:hypothetical protein